MRTPDNDADVEASTPAVAERSATVCFFKRTAETFGAEK